MRWDSCWQRSSTLTTAIPLRQILEDCVIRTNTTAMKWLLSICCWATATVSITAQENAWIKYSYVQQKKKRKYKRKQNRTTGSEWITFTISSTVSLFSTCFDIRNLMLRIFSFLFFIFLFQMKICLFLFVQMRIFLILKYTLRFSFSTWAVAQA